MKKIVVNGSFFITLLICCVSFTTTSLQQGGTSSAAHGKKQIGGTSSAARGKTPQSGTSSAAHGKTLYTQYCLVCHQADGGGVPNMNPPLIKTKYVLGDKKQLIKILLNGLQGELEVNGDTYHNVMPPQNALTDQEIADILTYVRSSFTNKASAVKPAEVKAQRALLPKAKS